MHVIAHATPKQRFLFLVIALYNYHCVQLIVSLHLILQTIGTLVEIQMPQNGIQFEGVAALAGSIKSNHNLKVSQTLV